MPAETDARELGQLDGVWVAACGCVPPYPETRGYVARILGMLGGAGEAVAGGGLEVRLVR